MGHLHSQPGFLKGKGQRGQSTRNNSNTTKNPFQEVPPQLLLRWLPPCDTSGSQHVGRYWDISFLVKRELLPFGRQKPPPPPREKKKLRPPARLAGPPRGVAPQRPRSLPRRPGQLALRLRAITTRRAFPMENFSEKEGVSLTKGRVKEKRSGN